jgi:hypothetical protein
MATEALDKVQVDQLRGALLSSPQEFRPDWLAQGNKVVVPFAPPLDMPQEVAARLGGGFRAGGNQVAWGFSAESWEGILPDEGVVVPLTPSDIRAWHSAFLPFDMVLTATDGSRAVLFGQDEFGLVAGPPMFVETVLGKTVPEACQSFASYAHDMKEAAQHLPEVARRYGCR